MTQYKKSPIGDSTLCILIKCNSFQDCRCTYSTATVFDRTCYHTCFSLQKIVMPNHEFLYRTLISYCKVLLQLIYTISFCTKCENAEGLYSYSMYISSITYKRNNRYRSPATTRVYLAFYSTKYSSCERASCIQTYTH